MPVTFVELGRLEVFNGGKRVENLNELEFVDGKIYANVLPQDRIAVIQPDTGQVTSWIDLAEIAYDRSAPVCKRPHRADTRQRSRIRQRFQQPASRVPLRAAPP